MAATPKRTNSINAKHRDLRQAAKALAKVGGKLPQAQATKLAEYDDAAKARQAANVAKQEAFVAGIHERAAKREGRKAAFQAAAASVATANPYFGQGTAELVAAAAGGDEQAVAELGRRGRGVDGKRASVAA